MLPRICDSCDPVSGTLRKELTDYLVEEQLLKEPSGNGNYLWVKVRQLDISTRQVAAALARSVQVDPAAIRYAATRDRNAEVHQWYSLPADEVEHVQALKNAGYKKLLKVLSVERSKSPIDREAIKSLRYRIRIRNAAQDAGYLRAKAILDYLRQHGCPNYIGFARMGPKGQYAKWGKLIAQAKHLPKQVPNKPLDINRYIYAYQSQIFNRYVAQRIEQDCFESCLEGDFLQTQLSLPRSQRQESLVVDCAQSQKRLDSWEAVVCGPLIGKDMQAVSAQALNFEQTFFADKQLKNTQQSAWHGGRRPIRFQPLQVACDDQRQDLIVEWTLDPDVYASNVLEELLQPEHHIV